MEVTEIGPIVPESAIGIVSIPGGKSDFDTTVRPVLVKVHTDKGITGHR